LSDDDTIFLILEVFYHLPVELNLIEIVFQ